MANSYFTPETHEYTTEEIEFIEQNIDSIITEAGVKLTNAARYTALDQIINFGGELDYLPMREKMITQIQQLVDELLVQMDEKDNTYGMPSEKDEILDICYVNSRKDIMTFMGSSQKETFTQYIVDMENDKTIEVRIQLKKDFLGK